MDSGAILGVSRALGDSFSLRQINGSKSGRERWQI
jgi:hypothetical protein